MNVKVNLIQKKTMKIYLKVNFFGKRRKGD